MNPVRVALSEFLKNDSELKKLATGGIFHRRATNGAVPPYVIFHKAAGIPSYAFAGPSMDKDVWVVKGVGARDDAEAIDKRLKEILDGGTLAIEGKAHQDLRHISDIDLDETVNGERVDHVGAEYKLDSEYE